MNFSQVSIFALFASFELSYATSQSGYLRSKDHGDSNDIINEENDHGKDFINEFENNAKLEIEDMNESGNFILERMLGDIHALPENIEAIHDSHPDVYQRIIDYSPVFDFDGDSCLPAATFTCDNSNVCVQNQGLPVSNSYGMTQGCRNANFMNLSNTYHRWNRYEGRDTWEFHLFALYFEKDQTGYAACAVPFCDKCCGHRHDLEQVLLVFKNGHPHWVLVSAHGDYIKKNWSSVPKLGNHPKVVYHSDDGGFNTHTFRFAKSGENSAENPTRQWVTPPVLTWNNMNQNMKAFLNTHDYMGRNMKINNKKFCSESEKGMNGIFRGETFGTFEFPSYCEGYNRGYFSEEGGGLSSFVQGPIEKVFCSGRYCDNMALQAKALPLDDIDYNQGGWTSWFSEEGSARASCPSNSFVVRVQCGGDYCDNLRLYCTPFAKDSDYAFLSTTPPKVSNWFSEEGGGSGSCGNGWAVVGMRCSGRYCDNLRLDCKKWGNNPDEGFTPYPLKTTYFSEEGGGYSEWTYGPIDRVFCSGRYCDNMALQAKVLSLDDIDYNQGGWTSWFSEEGSARASCPSNSFVVRVQCGGDYCDNLRLYCVPFARDGEYAFTPGFSTKQSSWFSEEGGGSGSCGNGWAVVGMRCSGSYCDNLRLDCKKWGNTSDAGFMPYPVKTKYFSEEGGGYSEWTYGPIDRVFCSGSYCDNMALQAKVLSLDDVDYSRGRWTGWFSEEGSARASCPSGSFVVRAQCSGRYCDNLRLYCVPFARDGEYAFTPGFSTKQSGWFSEEGGGSGSCGNGWAVVGMRCSGRYCDNLRLDCKKWGSTVPSGYINYGDKVYFQVNWMDNRWLNGGRGSGNAGVHTKDLFGSSYEEGQLNTAYKWTVRSTSGTGKRGYADPKNGQCLRYGDIISLQVNNLDNRWLSGGRGGGNEGVVTRDHLGSAYEKNALTAYQWIVRSTRGTGKRDYVDPKNGQCLKYDDIIKLQVNNLDNRWLSGGRGVGNEGVVTRDHLRSTYESETASTTYEWIVKEYSGDGTRP